MSGTCNRINRVNVFTITKGITNTFVFTIKAQGTSLPLALTGSDSFTCSLKNLEDSSVVLTKPLSITSAANGKVTLVITDTETELLESLRGDKEDRYYPKPVYSLLIECMTSNNGNFTAKVPYVYVD